MTSRFENFQTTDSVHANVMNTKLVTPLNIMDDEKAPINNPVFTGVITGDGSGITGVIADGMSGYEITVNGTPGVGKINFVIPAP